ncbi:hypothetical protein [Streptacidiphilus melanogenes]|uniref:hypothetical protein n=1 Tax=Streptacidiphilus melanogenes TaxID=411235 RepID=UPI0006938395|nr:hypothetical protein [Streptacidiphilus melanogenes]
MRLRRTSLLAAATLVAAASGATPAFAADPAPVPLQIPHYAHMLVDDAHQHLFISEGAGYSQILVTDFSGTKVGEIDNEPGADGLAISPDGQTLYAALANGDSVSAISTTTLTETARYSLGAGSAPASVAWAGGKLWVGYGGAAQGNIASIDPTTSPATVTLNQAPGWYAAPLLVSSPAAPNALLAADTGSEPPNLERYDVASGSPVKGAKVWLQNSAFVGAMQITPDGQDVVMAISAPYELQEFKLADLSADGVYTTTYYPNSVAVAPDGSIAGGSYIGNGHDLFLFGPRGATPLNSYSVGGTDGLATDGLAWSPDESRLFAVSSDVGGANPQLNVLNGPLATGTTLTLTGPATDTRAQQLTLTGKLSSAGTVPAGTHLTVTRTDAAHPGGTPLADAVVGADGSYTVTDSPQTGGANTYAVSFPGTAKLLASSATTTVQVSRAATAVSITTSGAGTFTYGATTTVTAHLGTTYNGRTVTIWEKAGNNGTKVLKTGTVDANGNLVASAKLAYNTTFTVSFAGDYRYAPASASKRVYTHTAVAEAQSGYYASGTTAGVPVKYFHHTGHPTLTATVTPNKAGECGRFQLQEYYSGAWHVLSTSGCFALSASSRVAGVVNLGSNSTNHLFRYAAEFVNGTDNTNLATWGAWQYFFVKS